MITRITPTLLGAWQWSFRREDGYDDFLATLRREPKDLNKAMQDGLIFENLVHHAALGFPPPDDHEWFEGVTAASAILQGSAEQVRGEKILTVDGYQYQLVGVADNIKAGVIYDTKLSRRYEYGRYHDSPQHPAYFALWPGAVRFTYLVYNGKDLNQETYHRFDTPPIEDYISAFRKYLNEFNLTEIYHKHWRKE